MSDYSDADTDYNDMYGYGDWWNPFDSPDDFYDDYLFYDDSYDDVDYDPSDSNALDVELASYMEHLTSGLRNLQNQNVFCDVTLTVEGKSFQAHKAILAASSDYFMAMFTSGFQEAGTAEVNIEGDSAIFENLLEFAYTGCIKDLSPETVTDIMSMAGYLQFTHALKMCKTYVTKKYGWDEKGMSLQKAYEISLLAEGYGLELKELIDRSKRYMTDNFVYLSKKEDFAEQTNIECLQYCLDSFNKQPKSQYPDNDLLSVITTWLKHKWSERKHHTHSLLKKLRLGLISTEVIEKLRDSSEMKELPECLTLLEEVLGLKLIKTPEWLTDVPLHISHPDLFAKRNTGTSLVAIGGPRGQNRSMKLSSSYVTWLVCERDIPRLPEKICNHSCIVVNGHLFLAGGIVFRGQPLQSKRLAQKGNNGDFEGRIHAKTFWFDQSNQQWHQLAYMKRARKNPALVHMDNYVFAIGGMSKGGPLKHVEAYCLFTKSWNKVEVMPMAVREPSAVVFQEKLLVYGMRDPKSDKFVLLMYCSQCKSSGGASSGSAVNGRWYLLRTDTHPKMGTGVYKPTLTVQDGKCYRVLYETLPASSEKGSDNNNVKHKAQVNEVICDFDARIPSASIGPEETQHEGLMKHVIGTVNFCINGSLYVNACGLVYRVGLNEAESASKKSEDIVWINLGKTNDILGSGVALYTYEES